MKRKNVDNFLKNDFAGKYFLAKLKNNFIYFFKNKNIIIKKTKRGPLW